MVGNEGELGPGSDCPAIAPNSGSAASAAPPPPVNPTHHYSPPGAAAQAAPPPQTSRVGEGATAGSSAAADPTLADGHAIVAPPSTQVCPPAVALRPGFVFQELLLHDFYTTAAPLLLGRRLPAATAIWVTPTETVRQNHFQVRNVLTYHLAAPPVLLRARPVSQFMFAADVASPNVAAFAAVYSPYGSGSNRVTVHSTLARAVIEAERLRLRAAQSRLSTLSPSPPPRAERCALECQPPSLLHLSA